MEKKIKKYSTEDFAKFAEFFNDDVFPAEAVESLEEIKCNYLERSLYISELSNKDIDVQLYIGQDIFYQIDLLNGIINLIKGLPSTCNACV
jgi:hypothetical protein